jgi:phosphatidylinositol-3-phosphatase
MKKIATTLGIVSVLAATGCQLNASNPGVAGEPDNTEPAVTGTVFTIIFENHEVREVLRPELPTFFDLSEKYGTADAYITDLHPSLLNYLVMTSGDYHGIGDSGGPAQHDIGGKDNLGEQLDAAGVKWRAYMESMGSPCKLTSNQAGDYVVNHNPFVYYTSLTKDKERCQDRVVDHDKHFDEDLASGQYQYMWITPNMCNNMHNCDPSVADAWLKKTAGKIMESPGYKNGGVLFIMFDEGSVRVMNAEANLATIVVSENLIEPRYSTDTRFDHTSYLATIEDIFGLPRLPTTKDSTPMDEFFPTRGAQKD